LRIPPIYDVTGRLVRRLVDAETSAEEHAILWGGRDESGNRVASGLDLYRMDVGGSQALGSSRYSAAPSGYTLSLVTRAAPNPRAPHAAIQGMS